MGKGGILEIKANMPGTNDYVKWASLTPRHNRFLDKLVFSDVNIIMCLRGKDEYVLEENEKGKQSPKKVGMGPQQRDGIEYECTCAFMLDQEKHIATVMKDNTHIFDGTNGDKLYEVLTEEHGVLLKKWADSGEPVTSSQKQTVFVPADREKLDRIVELWTGLGKKTSELKSELAKVVGKSSSSEMDNEDADKFIAHLESLSMPS